jgi:NAD(P)-dependent dehydrogenase (short-subunit alcohol dehydrogenase family)
LEETISSSGVDKRRALAVVSDIRDPDAREHLIDCSTRWQGHLFGLVNNAGITRLAPLLDESIGNWRDTIETNLEASYFLMQAAVDHMRKHGEGRVVNIASIHGIVGRDSLGLEALEASPGDRGPMRESAYAASKGALIQLTRDLATAVGRWGIAVNAVSPGFVEHPADEVQRRLAAPEQPGLVGKPDPWLKDAGPEIAKRLNSRVPLGRLGRVEDIAGSVSFLMSKDAAYITGMNLVVDGGFSAW